MLILQSIALLLNRFILCASWAIFYVYIGELFPTRVKSLGFGWASAMGTIGSSASPYFRLASDTFSFSPWLLPGTIGLIAAGSIFCLPETFGLPSQDEIQEKLTEVLSDDQYSDVMSPRTQKKDFFGKVSNNANESDGLLNDSEVKLDSNEEVEYKMVDENGKENKSPQKKNKNKKKRQA